MIIIKTPKLKFSDLGYIRHDGDAVEMELFLAGRSIKKIRINHLVCVDEGCMFKSTFNENFLIPAYPTQLLQNILLAQAIYDGKNRLRTDNGFEQRIQSESVDIVYRVSRKETYFKDKQNRIIFKIKDIK